MMILENAQVKALQLLDLVECVEEAIDDAAEEGGATPAVNKALNLIAILGEQLTNLVQMVEAAQRKAAK